MKDKFIQKTINISLKLRYEKGDFVFIFLESLDMFVVGQIDAYDVYSKKYLVFLGDVFGNEWFDEFKLYSELELKMVKRSDGYIILDKPFNKTTLREIIKWTSSRYNSYTKTEVIDQILKMKEGSYRTMEEGDHRTFECGSYAEGNYNGGWTWDVYRKGCLLMIEKVGTNEKYCFIIEELL